MLSRSFIEFASTCEHVARASCVRQLRCNDCVSLDDTVSSVCVSKMSTSAQDSFRANLAGFRWAQGNTDDSGAAEASTNPFARFTNSISAAIPLRSNARTNEEEAYVRLIFNHLPADTSSSRCRDGSGSSDSWLAVQERPSASSSPSSRCHYSQSNHASSQ